MAKKNAERWRLSVDLGPTFGKLLNKLVHCGFCREELGYHKTPSASRIIRLALLELARKKLPPEETAAIDMYDL